MDSDEKVLKLCREVHVCDDRLGQYSDYEGDEEGPTFSLWKRGKDVFAAQCECAIEEHTAAIKVWKKLRKLNQLR